jgi:hypothetical protein
LITGEHQKSQITRVKVVLFDQPSRRPAKPLESMILRVHTVLCRVKKPDVDSFCRSYTARSEALLGCKFGPPKIANYSCKMVLFLDTRDQPNRRPTKPLESMILRVHTVLCRVKKPDLDSFCSSCTAKSEALLGRKFGRPKIANYSRKSDSISRHWRPAKPQQSTILRVHFVFCRAEKTGCRFILPLFHGEVRSAARS